MHDRIDAAPDAGHDTVRVQGHNRAVGGGAPALSVGGVRRVRGVPIPAVEVGVITLGLQ